MKELLAKTYNEMNATHNYIFGFVRKHIVYKVTLQNVTAETIAIISKVDYDSRNKTASLRFIPTVAQTTYLMTLNPEKVCTEEEFESRVKANKYNRGENFENIIYEQNNMNWSKDKKPFTEDGDITINGTPYQIKYNKATFANMKTLENLKG